MNIKCRILILIPIFLSSIVFFTNRIYANDLLTEFLDTIKVDVSNEKDAVKLYFKKSREIIRMYAKSHPEDWKNEKLERLFSLFLAQSPENVLKDAEARSRAHKVISTVLASNPYKVWKNDLMNEEVKWELISFVETLINDLLGDAIQEKTPESFKKICNFQIWCLSVAKIKFPNDLDLIMRTLVPFLIV